jgi:lipid A 3-O-deacylase
VGYRMAHARAFVMAVSIVATSATFGVGQTPFFPIQQQNSSLTPMPGASQQMPPKTPGVWRPDPEPKDEPPVPPHLQLIPQWYPSPPPANYTTSSCNFNVWCGEERFAPDFSTAQVLLGGYTTRPGFGPRIPNFSYVPLSIRRGLMLNAPQDTEAFFRGNVECLFDVTLACTTSGYGTGFVAPSGLMRYNFVQPNAMLVPYVQGGAGFIVTDAYKDRLQRAIGQGCEFYLRAEMGVRCFISDNWSLDVECGFQHISNANMAERNFGVNALGAQIGFTYFFPSGGR